MPFQREYLLPALINVGTPQFRRFIVNILPWKNLRRLRDIINNMDKTMTHIFERKKRALAEGDEVLKIKVGEAKDIMSILMKANMAAKAEDRLPEDEVLAQVSFSFANTTSNALARTLYLLSSHPKVQSMLRDEIIEAQGSGNGELDYDGLNALPFLDAVCRETLRL
ncbi:hypothetical protein DXG03_008598 [Asterophora parasitica]|uniref:Cytochrome P450 n=1 Tax=Asterophora parasitica TaxID=117018 RepID=A0A9P7KCZ0_9AGAR|nr:hypothetical protein DXG03_008598 [Asterophora parasitica]